MTLISLGLVAVAVALTGWRWPVLGLTAGLIILAMVAVAIASRVGWVSNGSPFDPFNAIAFASVSAYPTLMGATAITVSALRLRDRRRG